MPNERIFEDWIDAYMEFTEESEPPQVFKKWCAISAIASALQRRCSMNLGWGDFYPNMYIVLVGPSGSRKGTAMRPARQLIDSLGIQIAAEATTREALIKRLDEAKAQGFSLTDNQATMHSSLTVHSQELTVFLGYNNQALMADLCDWFDCSSSYIYETKGSGTNTIKNVWFNLIGATTPSLIRSTLPEDAIGGGLTSRIIFVYGDKKHKIIPIHFQTEREAQLKTDLGEDLTTMTQLEGKFRQTEDYVDNWIEWVMQSEQNPPFQHNHHLAGYIDRRRLHLAKLSMIMSASRSNEMLLRAIDLEKAITFLEEVEKNMPKVFSGVGKNEMAEVMNRILTTIIMKKQIRYSEIVRLYMTDADEMEIRRIVATLNTSGSIHMELEKRKDGGNDYILSPAERKGSPETEEPKEKKSSIISLK